MYNPEYGTKDNPVPVLKMIGGDESIRDGDKDYDKAYMDSFYRKNVIRYLKYKMPKKEFERRFKNYCCPVKLKYHINPCGIAFI